MASDPSSSSLLPNSSSSLAASAAFTSLRRSRFLFDSVDGSKQNPHPASVFVPTVDPNLRLAALERRRRRQGYETTTTTTDTTTTKRKKSKQSQALIVAETVEEDEEDATEERVVAGAVSTSSVLARLKDDNVDQRKKDKPAAEGGILVPALQRNATSASNIPTPTWHAPWKLSTVLSSHLGWVRCLAMDPTNTLFASGSADRTIKVWNFAKASVGADDALQLTLTGHISPVRALAFSDRHPYLFSAGEDKTVKCWDLETNQVIRHYHGHLSGVFCLKLHPLLDILVTGGRDAVARVWDMRTKHQIHTLVGHEHTVAALLCQTTHPQVVTGSHDTTIKLWDLASAKCVTTLTHHSKSVRALCRPTFENTFMSGAADCLKQWQGKDGRFLKSFTGHEAVINAMAVNEDGVVVSGGDNGSMHFWDYKTGYCFQQAQSQVQPGSLEAENGIMATEFDLTGTRLITGEADKTIKIYKQDEEASEVSHPIDMQAWRKKCIAQAKQRY